MSPIYQGTSDVAINYGVKTSAPTSPSPTEGSEYWHKTNDKRYLYDGSNWASVDVTGPYTGGAATHWWTQAGLSDNDGWAAEKGSKNLTRYQNDNLTYTASDSNFNNKKSIGLTSSQNSYLAYKGSNNDFWNAKNEAFSIAIVTHKTFSSHSYGVADALFTHCDSFTTHTASWSNEPAGDHIWTSGGEHWQAGNASNVPGSLPWTGIYFLKFNSSGNGGAYWWAKGGSSWTTLGTATSWPANVNSSNMEGISFFMGPHATATNHRYQGLAADIIYWKGSSISDTERDLYKNWAVNEYGFG